MPQIGAQKVTRTRENFNFEQVRTRLFLTVAILLYRQPFGIYNAIILHAKITLVDKNS